MPSKIRVLDETTINKIAAGEVIGNSASCVKELIENAIDAKASFITVEVVAGGRSSLIIQDDGEGMNPDDAVLALERHATSKLRSIRDMDSLSSMGFRGEALASIGSISKLSLKTSTSSMGTEVIMHGGKLLESKPCAQKKGTRIEVGSLFYNVPARKAFQRSIHQDTQQITQLVMHLALAHVDISFRLVVDHKEVFCVYANSSESKLDVLKQRIGVFYGKEWAQSLIPIEQKSSFLSVWGFLGPLNQTRPNHSRQFFYINQRLIQSKLLQTAIDEGYSTRLPPSRFASAFLFLSLDPKEVDVNVHPQKKEVRFQKSLEIKQKLSSLVDKALSAHLFKEASAFIETKSSEPLKEHIEPSKFVFSKSDAYPKQVEIQSIEKPASSLSESILFEKPPQILGIFDRYLFVSAKSCDSYLSHTHKRLDGFLLIDQKAAKERLMYDYLLEKESQNIEIQNLLLAETCEFSPPEAALLDQHLNTLNAMGVSIRSLKGTTFMIDGLPAKLNTSDAKNILSLILEDLEQFGFQNSKQTSYQEILAKALASCVKYEKKIECPKEAEVLIQKLLKSKNPWVSPKGKAIIKSWDQNELTKLFLTAEK